jgi:hypothetical protein
MSETKKTGICIPRGSIAKAAGVVFFDVAFCGSIILSTLLTFLLPFVFLWRLWRRREPGSVTALKAAIYAVAIVLAFTLDGVNNKIAQRHGAEIVAACESYKAATGNYPQKLDELVPKYLPKIPHAKYRLMQDLGFWYIAGGGYPPILLYTEQFPFGRRAYSFSRKAWGYED